ncbi:hypothetical protein DL98DRAFT_539943 [Cadophora sp. DSE1049]|nr:hypothetical protein DL98DRAFT_539943 [Cadophora sp. DSE1049]
MLLTKQLARHGYKPFHDCSPPTPPPTSSFSPVVKATDKALPLLPPPTSFSPIVKATNKALPPLPLPTSGSSPVVKGTGKALPPLPLTTSSSTTHRMSTSPHGQPMASYQLLNNGKELKNQCGIGCMLNRTKTSGSKGRKDTAGITAFRTAEKLADHITGIINRRNPTIYDAMVFEMAGDNLPNASLELAQKHVAQADHLQQQQFHTQQ